MGSSGINARYMGSLALTGPRATEHQNMLRNPQNIFSKSFDIIVDHSEKVGYYRKVGRTFSF